MATWLENLRNADANNKQQEKLAREMTHRPQAPIESLRGQDPMTDWALGMRERTLSPLSTLAGEAKRFQGLTPQEIGMELVGGGMAGMTKNMFGRIAETGVDTRKLADMLERSGISKGYNVTREGSAISPSQYITFRMPTDETGELTRQIRISNHPDKYPELASGVRYSTDPSTGQTFEQAVNWLGKEGFPTKLSEKYSSIPDYQTYYAQQQAIRELPDNRLNQLISAWRNKPKATRGEIPTLDDVKRLYGK